MKLAFLLLAHDRPDLVYELASQLAGDDSLVVLHWDANAGEVPMNYFQEHQSTLPAEKIKHAGRVRGKWGDWSLVQATINCLETLVESGFDPEYVCLLGGSSDCPIKSRATLEAFLERNRGHEFIESWPANDVYWVAGGPQRERYELYYPFNWKSHHGLAQRFMRLQQKLGVKRKFPRGLVPHIGSQWWSLTYETILKLRPLYKNESLVRFFKATLIPDEHFFQTLVRSVVEPDRIANKTLTYYQFTDYYVPLVFHERHLDYLKRQPFFFARKISAGARKLRTALLADCWEGAVSELGYPDAEIGIRSDEYRNFIAAHRYGTVPGRAVYADYVGFMATARSHSHGRYAGAGWLRLNVSGDMNWFHRDRRHRNRVVLAVAVDGLSLRSVLRYLDEHIPQDVLVVHDARSTSSHDAGETSAGVDRVDPLMLQDTLAVRDRVADLMHAHSGKDVMLIIEPGQLWGVLPEIAPSFNTYVVLYTGPNIDKLDLHLFGDDYTREIPTRVVQARADTQAVRACERVAHADRKNWNHDFLERMRTFCHDVLIDRGNVHVFEEPKIFREFIETR